LAARPHPPRRPHRLALCRRNRSCSARGSATPGVLEAVLEAVLEVVRPWVRRSDQGSDRPSGCVSVSLDVPSRTHFRVEWSTVHERRDENE